MNRNRCCGLGALALAAALAGCGEDNLGPGDRQVPPDLGPFAALDIVLRPLSIQRPTIVSGYPTPAMAVYNLTAFYQGGRQTPSFTWIVPESLGQVEPKGPNLTVRDAAVLLRIRPDGRLPLGLFDFEARGTSGNEPSNVRRRLAVVENVWQKHRRATYGTQEPADLILYPVFLAREGAPATADTIIYVEAASTSGITLRRIPAFRNLAVSPEVDPADAVIPPQVPLENNYLQRPRTMPDVAPDGSGRREILFASLMNSQYPMWPDECGLTPCRNDVGTIPCPDAAPSNLWVVAKPMGLNAFQPRQLTFDSTRCLQNETRVRWIGYNFDSPRWDPSARGDTANIAFLSDLPIVPGGARRRNVWLARLVNRNEDATSDSDTLVGYRPLTTFITGGGASNFAWHPDGTRILFLDAGGFSWVDVNSGAVQALGRPDSSLVDIQSPSVFARGSETLIAFQGRTENLVNIYVWDEQTEMLTRLLPFSTAVTHNLFPRWHPTRKQIVYVSDYTVEAWANTAGSYPPPDRLNPRTPEEYGQRRTAFPSVWVVKLED